MERWALGEDGGGETCACGSPVPFSRFSASYVHPPRRLSMPRPLTGVSFSSPMMPPLTRALIL